MHAAPRGLPQQVASRFGCRALGYGVVLAGSQEQPVLAGGGEESEIVRRLREQWEEDWAALAENAA